jgi:deoxyribodipyrimidine photolyase-related protein
MKKSIVTAWIAPDQLILDHPAIAIAEREVGRDRVRVLLIENASWMNRLPFHRQRKVLIRSAGRRYACELAELGYRVDVVAAATDAEGLADHIKRNDPERIVAARASEFEPLRFQLDEAERVAGRSVEIVDDPRFLVNRFNPIVAPDRGKRYVMETFYRSMRKHFKVLIEPDGTPTGGRWNFDAMNRRRPPRDLDPPAPPVFELDAITRKTIAEVDAEGSGVGSTEGFAWGTSRADAEHAFTDFIENRLADFGPYEDAMSSSRPTLYHSLLSPYMNLGLLDPLDMVRAAESAYRRGAAPIESVEGFVRQILGWREFIYWQYHRLSPELASMNAWNARRPIPNFLWNGETELHCVKTVVDRLLKTAYTHHIERLMIICNFCLLTGVDPSEVSDWFKTFYIDSHDWVVEPNVIGMGLNADGGIVATKPYIASAAYINKMSDYCASCSFDPKKRTGSDACPFNYLYWNFLIEHESELRSNPRLGPAVLGTARIKPDERAAISREAATFLASIDPNQDASFSSD